MSKQFRVIAEIKIVNQDGEIVDNRGLLPRKNEGGQFYKVECSGHDSLMEANKMLRSVHAIVDVVSDIRDIQS